MEWLQRSAAMRRLSSCEAPPSDPRALSLCIRWAWLSARVAALSGNTAVVSGCLDRLRLYVGSDTRCHLRHLRFDAIVDAAALDQAVETTSAQRQVGNVHQQHVIIVGA